MNGLWRGTPVARARILSGLVLFVFLTTHLLNVALGLLSEQAMLTAQDWRTALTRSLPGTLVVYAALATHAGLAILSLARRRTLKMPLSEAAQLALGLAIPVLLVPHIVFTRVADQVYGVDDRMPYLIARIFGSWEGWMQAVLVLIAWAHGAIGIRMWLGREPWWPRAAPWLTAAVALLPALALCGFLSEGRRVAENIVTAGSRDAFFARYGSPSPVEMQRLFAVIDTVQAAIIAALGLSLLIFAARRFWQRQRQVRVTYTDGPTVRGRRGLTLLEISREANVPHTSQCGGRGRCTTCRVVVVEGADRLPLPSPSEAKSLRAVGAGPDTRLACQIRPDTPLLVARVVRPGLREERQSEASHGQERRLAILFLDIRGFTARSAGRLPYDVVFMLNRFFDAIVPAIRTEGGRVDKYLGDGLLALFESPAPRASAAAAIRATAAIGRALADFNHNLSEVGVPEMRIGIGVHLGDLVIGEIGAAGDAPLTIIGEAVNAASRLEAMTKELGVEAILSEAVLREAGVAVDTLGLVSLDLRGVAVPVRALALPSAAAAGSLAPAPAADTGAKGQTAAVSA